MRSPAFVAASLLLSVALAACNSDGRTRGPSTSVTAVHAAPSFGELAFLREERVVAALAYRNPTTALFEVDQYDFNVDAAHPGETTVTRELTFSQTLAADTDHFFIITESGGALAPLIVTKPPFSPTASDAEVSLIHAGTAFPAVSVYVTAPGADLSAANPIGSASYTQTVAPQTFAVGDYRLLRSASDRIAS